MARRHSSFVILLIGLALAGGAYAAANSSSPSPPTTTTSNTTDPSLVDFYKKPVPDYSDYEVPMNLAPDGVELVQDYVQVSHKEDKEADELSQPEGKSDKKTNEAKDSASSSSSSSFSFVFFVVVAGLFFF